MLFGRNPSDFIISRNSHIIDFRDSAMPDSPDTKSTHSSNLSPKAPLSAAVNSTGRPLSSNSSISGINGHHSPLSTLNGRTPSPSGPLMNPSMGQQLPPACGARQLSKLKRFLTTLQQFGSDISPEIGERVRSLVLGLVNSHLSIEEFHSKLQEATNFPLRPFVIPFLKANLPLLQRELLHCARVAKQSPQQFLTQNEHVVFDPAHSPLDPRDDNNDIINENGKRVSPDRPKENGLDLHLEGPALPVKRHHSNSSSHPVSPMSANRASPSNAFSFGAGGGPIRLEDISKSREMRERVEREQMERERERVDRERERHYSSYSYRSNESFENLERLDDDWRHVETMLNCILGMVDKTKRAITVLQDRSVREREELSLWSSRRQPSDTGLDMGSDMKKRSPGSSDSMIYNNYRQTEDRVTEVRRRAEEAVNDVKRQAMLELQKAMSAADQKALDLVASERSKMERALTDVRKQTQEDMLRTLAHQEETSESCWNCGRKASETCSGCNVARYCGSFCQHKDWENHHHVCGKAHITTVAEARDQRRAALAAAAAAAAAATVTATASSASATSSATATTSAVSGSGTVVSSTAFPSSSSSSSSSASSSTSSSSTSLSCTSSSSSSLLSSSSSSSSSTVLTTAASSVVPNATTISNNNNNNNRDSLTVSTSDNITISSTPTTSMLSPPPKSPPKIHTTTTAGSPPHHVSLTSSSSSSAPSIIPSLSAKESLGVPPSASAPAMSPHPHPSPRGGRHHVKVESNPNSPAHDSDSNTIESGNH